MSPADMLDLAWTDIGVELQPPNTGWPWPVSSVLKSSVPPIRVLHDVSGSAQAGETLAIMGPSGTSVWSVGHLYVHVLNHPR